MFSCRFFFPSLFFNFEALRETPPKRGRPKRERGKKKCQEAGSYKKLFPSIYLDCHYTGTNAFFVHLSIKQTFFLRVTISKAYIITATPASWMAIRDHLQAGKGSPQVRSTSAMFPRTLELARRCSAPSATVSYCICRPAVLIRDLEGSDALVRHRLLPSLRVPAKVRVYS